jgi:predicted enzyme related to lactoylglutathione lyase
MSDRVVHFEIPADDLERAKTFYSEAFGWNLQQWPGFDYVMVTTTPANEQGTPSEPGGINGGMLLRQGPIANPIVTIEVADMEAALQTVADKGGTVVRGKEPVGEVGFAAYFTDTEGNTLGLWESRSPAS